MEASRNSHHARTQTHTESTPLKLGPAPAPPYALEGLKLRWKKAFKFKAESPVVNQGSRASTKPAGVVPVPVNHANGRYVTAETPTEHEIYELYSPAQTSAGQAELEAPNRTAVQTIADPSSSGAGLDITYQTDPQPSSSGAEQAILPDQQPQRVSITAESTHSAQQEVPTISTAELIDFQTRAKILEVQLENFVRNVLLQLGKRNPQGEPTIFCNTTHNGGGDHRHHRVRIVIGGDEERLVKIVERQLARFHGRRLVEEGFEVGVEFNPGLGFVGGGDVEAGLSSPLSSGKSVSSGMVRRINHGDSRSGQVSDTNTVLIDLDGDSRSLCGAMIRVESGRESSISLTMWTCGGLISVDGQFYALSVAHPLKYLGEDEGRVPGLESDDHDPTTSPTTSVDPSDAILSRFWRPLGKIVGMDLSGLNSDWILIEVAAEFLLPSNLFDRVSSAKFGRVVESCTSSEGVFEGRKMCQLYSPRGVLVGYLESGQSYLTIGEVRFRTFQVTLELQLERGDSGSWVVQEERLFGVVIARGTASRDTTFGYAGNVRQKITLHTALVLHIDDVFASISRSWKGATVRLPTSTEHQIMENLRRVRLTPAETHGRYPRIVNLYAQDIYTKYLAGLGTLPILPPLEHLNDIDIDLRPFLAIGHAFPLSPLARSAPQRRLRYSARIWRFRLPGSQISSTAVTLARRLLTFQGGENFAVLLGALRTVLSSDPRDVWEFTNRYLDLIGFPGASRPSFDVLVGLCDLLWSTPNWLDRKRHLVQESPAELARLLFLHECAERMDCFLVCGGCKGFRRMVVALTDVAWWDVGEGAVGQRELGLELGAFPRVFFVGTGRTGGDDDDDDDAAAASALLVERSRLYEAVVVGTGTGGKRAKVVDRAWRQRIKKVRWRRWDEGVGVWKSIGDY